MMGKRNKPNLEQPPRTKNNTANVNHSNIFFTVLFYCLLIIVSPIVTFFGSKFFIFDSIFESIPSNIWSAISSVVVLHLALGLFLYRAYFSDEPTKSSQKQD